MKYWRGYLVAAIVGACSWGLMQFAKNYTTLVDMLYPYMTRFVISYLAGWSSGVAYCLWQLILIILGAGVLASIVLMIVLRWNPIQWFGWILAVASVIFLLHTGIYGLNYYAGSVADDLHLEVSEYTVSELETAATYFRDQANALAQSVPRKGSGELNYAEFDTLAQKAGDGFHTLTYQQAFPVFAGATQPVKKLGWSKTFTDRGITGVTIALTGESAVNPDTPAVILPYVMCREMAHRMSIAGVQDASFAAFLACAANTAPEFQYAAYFMAYRYCYDALCSLGTSTGQAAATRVRSGVGNRLAHDLADYDAFFLGKQTGNTAGAGTTAQDTYLKDTDIVTHSVCDMLTSWYIQEFVLPQEIEVEIPFDPFDETQVDLSGLIRSGS